MDTLIQFGLSILDQGLVVTAWVFGLFKDARVAIGLALFLVSLAVVTLSYLWFIKISPVAKDLSWVSRQVGQLKSYSDFVDAFPRVDMAMSRIKVIAHPWNEFKKTLIFPEKNTKQPIRNTQMVGDYINMDTAAESGLDFKFFHAMVDYFVGIGLVFTFLGLVSALNFASEGLAADDPEETKRQFANLLHAATFKFLTSICGVGMSIIYGVIQRILLDKMHHYFVELVEVLEKRMVFVTPESVAFAQFRELQQQNQHLSNLTKQLLSNNGKKA